MMDKDKKVIINIQKLSKEFLVDNNKNTILNNVDFQLKEGEFVSIMGPSGSGKSTLLYSVSGMDKMSSGEVIFDGQKMSEISNKQNTKLRLEKMGFVFQQMYMLKNLSVFDNIVLPAYSLNKEKKSNVNKYAYELMKKLEIESIKNNRISEVSGGQLQRACICRALINKPKILFADEPTGALNSKATKEVLEILTRLNKENLTIFMVSHDVKVSAHAEKIIYIVDGGIKGELCLGKVTDNSNLKDREEKLKNWLSEMGW